MMTCNETHYENNVHKPEREGALIKKGIKPQISTIEIEFLSKSKFTTRNTIKKL